MLKPILLIALIQTESGWNPNARSHAGAVGLGQMTPIAVREVQNVYGIDTEPDLVDPCQNVVWSVLYFSLVQAATRSQVEALVAYNGGGRQLFLYRQRLPIAGETDQYWRRVLKLKRDYDRTFARVPEPPTAREQWITGILAGLQPGGGGTYLDLAGVRLDASETAARALSVCGSVGGPPPATAISGHSNHFGI
jgi:hypothetical protein